MMTEPTDLDELFPDEGRQAIDAYQAWRLEFFLPGQQSGDGPSAAAVPEQRKGAGVEDEDSTSRLPRRLHDQVCPDPLTDESSGPPVADAFPAPCGGEGRD